MNLQVILFHLTCTPVTIEFFKYQGTGNDFVVIDNSTGHISLGKEAIVRLCDRKFGIGSDGVVLIERSDSADFYMNFYNPDGSQSFCGNGSRCAVRFAQKIGLTGNVGQFGAIDMVHSFQSDADEVRIQMRNVRSVEKSGEDQIIQTGSPHYIVFTDDPSSVDIVSEARKIRYNNRFADEGINVNFVKEGQDEIWMRTYERGVEDETLSCGTGVTAAALAYASRRSTNGLVKVHTQGGDLSVNLSLDQDGGFSNIWLCGPAHFIFKGTIDL
jgi:diaminopimelate epimerase